MPPDKKYSAIRSVETTKLIQVIVNTMVIGRGTDDDPVRRVTRYWSLEGELLAYVDPCCASTH